MRRETGLICTIALLITVGACSVPERAPLAPSESPSSVGPVTGVVPDIQTAIPPRRRIGRGITYRRPDTPMVPGEVVVKLEPGYDFEAFHAKWGTSTIHETPEGFARLALANSSDDPWEWSDEMNSSTECEHAEPNWVAEAPESHQGTLPFYEGNHVYQDVVDQDALARIGIPAAHTTATGLGVVVAVLDTGIDATHPALAASVIPGGRDFVDDDFDPSEVRPGLDEDGDGILDEAAGHGTHVAGLVHAVAPDASILAVRVLDSEGRGTSVGVARGIRWAAANGADVINLSLGMYVEAEVIKRAVRDVNDTGVVVVNAAGNLGLRNEHHFPSRMSRVMSIAASNEKDGRADFSNWGSSVALAAPGVGLLSTGLDHSWAVWSGTSMSTPLVSGAAALALELSPGAEPDQIGDSIEDSCADLAIEGTPWDGDLGAGRLDCAELVVTAP